MRERRRGAVRGVLLIAIICGLVVSAAGASGSPHGVLTVYASPSGSGRACAKTRPCSIVTAQATVRRALAKRRGRLSSVTVLLAGGVYRLNSGLKFGPADSGRPGLTVAWKAAPGSHPVISGGTRIGGWTKTKTAGVWSAKVPASLQTRSLFVDGREAQMSSMPSATLAGLSLTDWNKVGFNISGTTSTYFTRLASQIGARRVKGLQFVFSPMRPTDWEESECPVASISPTMITMAEPCWDNLTQRTPTVFGAGNDNVTPYDLAAGSAPTEIVNAEPLLTAAGQWYLDTVTHTLYYRPLRGQDLATADVEAGRLQSLMRVTGTLAHEARYLTFQGLTFRDSTWNEPSTDIGYPQVQGGMFISKGPGQGECTFGKPEGSCPWAGFSMIPAAVQLIAASHVTFAGDQFTELGEVGVGLRYGSDDDLIQGSTFSQIGASSIWLGCSGDPQPVQPNRTLDPEQAVLALCASKASTGQDRKLADTTAEIMTGNVVDNNVIHDVGYDYLGNAGVTMLFSRRTTISHNDIFDTPYDGLTSGAWQGHPDNPNYAPYYSSTMTTNVNSRLDIVDNYIHNTMQVYVGDGGPVYTEGKQGMTVKNADGSVNVARSYADGEHMTGNIFAVTPSDNYAYAEASDVGSSWQTLRDNVEWGVKTGFGCGGTPGAKSWGPYTYDNWTTDASASGCANHEIPADPGPSDLPISILAHAGVQGRFQSLEAALPPTVDYAGVSGAGTRHSQVLITGSGFTPSVGVSIDGTCARKVRFVSSGVLVVTMPGVGTPPTVRVTRARTAACLALTSSSTLVSAGSATTQTVRIHNQSASALRSVAVKLSVPHGWSVSPKVVKIGSLARSAAVTETFKVTAPAGVGAGSWKVTAIAAYTTSGKRQRTSASEVLVSPYPSLASSFNNVGITDDSDTAVGNIDNDGSSYSAQALAAAGVTPGGAVTAGGVTFTWPNVAAGTRDNTVPDSQAIALTGTGTTLGLLETAAPGPLTGTATIAYSDGTTQTFTMSAPDWLASDTDGATTAITCAYRNRPTGQQTVATKIYEQSVTLETGKTPVALILPAKSSAVQIFHVFAVTIGTPSS